MYICISILSHTLGHTHTLGLFDCGVQMQNWFVIGLRAESRLDVTTCFLLISFDNISKLSDVERYRSRLFRRGEMVTMTLGVIILEDNKNNIITTKTKTFSTKFPLLSASSKERVCRIWHRHSCIQ